MIQQSDHATIAERLKDFAKMEAALQQAARQAVLERAVKGEKIAVWRDNQVVWELALDHGKKSNE